MTTKTAEKTTEYTNGHAPAAPPAEPIVEVEARQLSAFQKEYMTRLMSQFERAQDAVIAAQNSANDFIVACAKDAGITVGKDGWAFDPEAIEFVRGDPDGPNS